MLICALGIFNCSAQSETLRNHIAEIAKEAKGIVGVSVLNIETGDTLSYNGYKHFPMQSVMKYPIAITVLHEIDKGKFTIDQPIHVDKSDYYDTYSPLKDKYPEGNINVSIKELLSYMVSLSDNIACDVLLKTLGGTDKVDAYMHTIGINNIAIKASEYQMAQAWDVQFTNWVQPKELTRLLKISFKPDFLSPPSYAYLWKIMQATSTGPKQIKGLLPEGTIVYHKTGRSGTNAQGISAATNDVGIITLPDGIHLAIAILLSNSSVDMPTRESVIARIAKAAYDNAVKQ
ncbi:Extended-spectrum beta-lactamase PER-1 [Mucilaginibacter polytrichastri]|uniref:beta-lactamase n=1 Tax=Mucilaginibacter polytrichastri TaxID=1302689 RepID=A0A1Q5ZZ70_9SPHI|nr:Extended-spectrum beta-lactamase PER-1 [Mucilaginibacter polytrichastri]SFS86746.1 beta-lactamase class A [Mucilaginibacter polytrichastri]